MTKLSITIEDNIFDALDCLSNKIGIKKSKLIEMSLLGKKSLEDIELENLIDNLKDEESIPYEQARNELGWE